MGSILCVYCESPCSSSLTPVDPYLGGRLLFSESGKRRKYTAYTGSRIYGLGKSEGLLEEQRRNSRGVNSC